MHQGKPRLRDRWGHINLLKPCFLSGNTTWWMKLETLQIFRSNINKTFSHLTILTHRALKTLHTAVLQHIKSRIKRGGKTQKHRTCSDNYWRSLQSPYPSVIKKFFKKFLNPDPDRYDFKNLLVTSLFEDKSPTKFSLRSYQHFYVKLSTDRLTDKRRVKRTLLTHHNIIFRLLSILAQWYSAATWRIK